MTLTATVTAGATGKVTFYDGVTILGIGTLSGTQASTTTVMLPSGNRMLRAHYQGDETYAASDSQPLGQAVIAGSSAGFRAPASYPKSTNTLALAVGDFNGDNLLDVAMTNLVANSVTVYRGNGDGTFQVGATYSTGAQPEAIAVCDFDGDGWADLAIANWGSANVSILLGNGDGTFRPAVSYATGLNPSSLVVADFNNDGKADLAVAGNSTNVTVLVGNGDGSFRAGTTVAATGTAVSLAVADFNRDGFADLAVAAYSPGALNILLGNGDGTFQAPSVPVSENLASEVLTADFNGDGIPDILLRSNSGLGGWVLLGKGDGTFDTALATSLQEGAVIEDFNGDGKPDLAEFYYLAFQQGFVGLALGNGDGTFGAAVLYPGNTTNSLGVAGDFNGDGKVDLVVAAYSPVASSSASGFTVLLGGALPDLTIAVSHGIAFTQGQQGEYTITVSNGPDLASAGAVQVTAALATGLNATSLGGSGWTCTLANLTCTRNDSLAAGASYPSILLKCSVGSSLTGSVTSTFTVAGGGEENTANDTASDTTTVHDPTATTLTTSPNPSVQGQAVTLTSTVTAGASGSVVFYSGVTPLGSAPVAAGGAVFSTSLLPSGPNALRAVYTGDSNFGPSSSVSLTQTVTAVPVNGDLPPVTYNVASTPLWMVTGDFDGDGKPDLATGNQNGVISVLLGNGDGSFQTALNYTLGNGITTSSALVGDFNNDGKQDLIVAGSAIAFLAGNGDGTFRSPQEISTSGNAVATADFNGDGIPDLVAFTGDYGTNLVVFAGNGDGTFQAPVTIASPGTTFSSLNVGDMNGDGLADIVVVNDYSVEVLLGNGDGTFQPPISTPANYALDGGLLIGDFNGDGKLDVAEGVSSGPAVMLGNGDGTLGPPIGAGLHGLLELLGDFNGDGKLDVVDGLSLVFGNGDGTFQAGPTLGGCQNSCAFAAADFDRNGSLDLAVANESSGTVSVRLGGQFSGLTISATHAGKFAAGQTGVFEIGVANPAFAATGGAVTVTDSLPSGVVPTSAGGTGWTCTLNPLSCTRSDSLAGAWAFYPAISVPVNVGAGLASSIVTNRATVTNGGIQNSASDTLTVFASTGITLAASPNPAVFGQPVTLTAAVDAGATGNVIFSDNGTALETVPLSNGQAVLSTRLLPSGPQLLMATYNGDATHAPNFSVSTQSVNAVPSVNLNVAAALSAADGPWAIAAGDFDQDGNTDLAVANFYADTVSVFRGHGDGTFGARTDYSLYDASAVAVADFNNDGIPDLAVASEGGGSVNVMPGNGDGTFRPAISSPAGSEPTWLGVGDFNGDGNADLLVQDNSYGISVLLGVGDGTFQAPLAFALGTNSVALGDFNRDGRIDIAGAGPGFLLGNGDGTFQPLSGPATFGATSMAIGDLNGDGIADIVGADPVGVSGVTVYLGNGDGTFQPGAYYPTAAVPYSVLLADVNGDGKLDVVTVNAAAGCLGVFLGNGDGTLQAPTFLPAGDWPEHAVAGDFNGDGLTDLAVTSELDNTVVVLLGGSGAVLAVSSAHADPFAISQSIATYALSVKNTGPVMTSGRITVADTLPTGVSATAMAGNGWNCTLSSLTCTRADPLGGGASYPPIAVTVSVTATTTGSGTNTVSVWGGGAATSSAFDPTTIAGPPITIQTVPPGLQFGLDNGAIETAPATVNPAPGAHTLAVASPQAGPSGTQYVFTGWSDGGEAAHTIMVGATPATYTASFKTQYQLTTQSLPQMGGSVTPLSSGFYDAGSSVSVTAAANPPYALVSWSGDATGSSNQIQVTMAGPETVTAYFGVPGFTCDVAADGSVDAGDVQGMINEALGAMPAVHDLTGDGLVDIADIQVVIYAALGRGCTAQE